MPFNITQALNETLLSYASEGDLISIIDLYHNESTIKLNYQSTINGNTVCHFLIWAHKLNKISSDKLKSALCWFVRHGGDTKLKNKMGQNITEFAWYLGLGSLCEFLDKLNEVPQQEMLAESKNQDFDTTKKLHLMLGLTKSSHGILFPERMMGPAETWNYTNPLSSTESYFQTNLIPLKLKEPTFASVVQTKRFDARR